MQKQKKVLIIGMGNPLSGDDGFGCRVLEILRNSEPLPDTELQDAHTDLLGRLDHFAEYERVLLIDAILDPENKLGDAGRVLELEETEFLAWPELSESVHQMSPLLAVKLFRQLYPGSQVRITLIGLLVDRIGFDAHYSTDATVQQGVAKILRNIRTL
jgi:hydrogenase maturation protease